MGLPNTFADNFQIEQFTPGIVANVAANGLVQGVAEWINVTQFQHVTILFAAGAAGSGTVNVVLTLRQATAAAGTGAKALNFGNRLWYKEATNLSTEEQFTKATGNSGNNTFTFTATSNREQIVLIDFDVDIMDTSGGFTHIEFSVADVGTVEKNAVAFCFLTNPRYAQPAATMKIGTLD